MCLANYSCVRDPLQNNACPELLAFCLELLSIVLQMANLRSRFLMGKWVSKFGCRMGWLPRKRSQRRFWGFILYWKEVQEGLGDVWGAAGNQRLVQWQRIVGDCLSGELAVCFPSQPSSSTISSSSSSSTIRRHPLKCSFYSSQHSHQLCHQLPLLLIFPFYFSLGAGSLVTGGTELLFSLEWNCILTVQWIFLHHFS